MKIKYIALGLVSISLLAAGCNQSATTTTNTEPTSQETPSKDAMMKGVEVGGALMTPDLNIVANASHASNVTTLVAAVQAAGLVDTLSSKGPFTVFAPTNDAFAKLPAGTVENLLKPENKATLVDILTYHVVAGSYKIADLQDGQVLTSVEGKQLKIKKTGTQVWVNGAAMVQTGCSFI
jgi:uncharacterized surface protein with fasciclin (FAS1) repeats